MGAPFVTGGANLPFPSGSNGFLPGARPGVLVDGSGVELLLLLFLFEKAGSGGGPVSSGGRKVKCCVLPSSAVTAGFENSVTSVEVKGCVIFWTSSLRRSFGAISRGKTGCCLFSNSVGVISLISSAILDSELRKSRSF